MPLKVPVLEPSIIVVYTYVLQVPRKMRGLILNVNFLDSIGLILNFTMRTNLRVFLGAKTHSIYY